MSTKIQYLVVTGEESKTVNTLKEVSALLGERVTKARINAGEFEGIVTELVGEESIDDINEGVARVYVGNDEYEGIKLTNPVDHSENNKEDDNMEDNNVNEEELINELVNGIVDEDDTSEEDTTEEDGVDEDTTDEPTEEDTTTEGDTEDEDTEEDNEEDKSTNKANLQELMAKMKELNAKKQSTTEGTTTTKSKKTKTIEFTGEYPEVGFFKEKKQLQKFYKQLTDEQLNDWIELEGLVYKESDNEPINRMRKCMAILNLHFPKTSTGSTKKKSKYADFSTEQLLEMALDNDVEVKEAKGDERILRMYAIMALRNAGLLE